MTEQATSSDAQERAFALLVEVVRDLRDRGRSTLLQGVKPQLQRADGGAFSEQALGFATFGDFVLEAARRGLIELRPQAGGTSAHLPDYDPEQPVPIERAVPRAEASTTPASRRVRADLWRAFVDWDERSLRLWDRAEQQVRFLPRAPVVEAGEQAAARLGLSVGDPRFVAIEPLGLERQLAWMRTFAEQHSSKPVGQALVAVLDPGVARPAQAFARTLRADDVLRERWVEQRLGLVAEHITAWVERNDLDLSIWDADDRHPRPPAQPHDTGRAGRSTLAVTRDVETEHLRAVAHRAINQMTREELLALPVRLGSLFDHPA